MKKINFIGYASGIAAGNPACADGPDYLKNAACFDDLTRDLQWSWKNLTPSTQVADKYQIVAEINTHLAQLTEQMTLQKEIFVVVGGDHSSGIGTWSGSAKAIHFDGSLGLIWIDAHLDAHLPETTPSCNIHGMPVATLLGHGAQILTHIAMAQPKIKPENLCMIGVRSFELGEQALLEHLGVRVYYIEEVQQRGFEVVFQEALMQIRKSTTHYGVSIDLDALDPTFAPGTGTPEGNGLDLHQVCQAMSACKSDDRFLGLEIAEFNPHECPDGRTVKAICQLIRASCV